MKVRVSAYECEMDPSWEGKPETVVNVRGWRREHVPACAPFLTGVNGDGPAHHHRALLGGAQQAAAARSIFQQTPHVLQQHSRKLFDTLAVPLYPRIGAPPQGEPVACAARHGWPTKSVGSHGGGLGTIG